MPRRIVPLRLGGQTYRVTTSASDEELQRLAAVVDQKLAAVSPPGTPISPQAMLLAAMALAHDLEQERARSARLLDRAREAFHRILHRVDGALAVLPGPAAPSPSVSPSTAPSPGETTSPGSS